MASKRPRRKFNLFDEEFGNSAESSAASSEMSQEDAVSRRIRIRQAIVDLPLANKIEFLKAESKDVADLEELKSTFIGTFPARGDSTLFSFAGDVIESNDAPEVEVLDRNYSRGFENVFRENQQANSDFKRECSPIDSQATPSKHTEAGLSIDPGENRHNTTTKDGSCGLKTPDKPRTNLGQSSDNSRTTLGQWKTPTESSGNEDYESNLGQSSDKLRTNLGHEPRAFDEVATTGEVADNALSSTNETAKPRTNLGQAFVITPDSECKAPLSNLDDRAENLGQTSDNSRTNLGHVHLSAARILCPAKIETSSFDGNLRQTSDNPKTTLRTNVGQSQDKPKTVTKAKPRTSSETSDKPRTEPRTKAGSNLGQSSDKPRTVSTLQALSGLQQNIAQMMYQLCCEKGGRTTGPVSIEFLIAQLGSTRLSIQKTIQRLENKEFLVRLESKSGRGGWTVYEIPNVIWNEFRQTENIAKLRTNLGQTSDILRSQPRTEPRTNVASKLVSNLNKDLLTTSAKPEFADPDLSEVSKFGITAKHIQDIRNQKLQVSFIDLQGFITKFGVYASDSKNIRTVKSVPALFISMVQKLAEGEDPLAGIQTPEEQLIQKLLNEKKAARERKQAVEEELERVEFESWFEVLGKDKALSMVAEKRGVFEYGSVAYQKLLFVYFKEQVWPAQRREMLKSLI